jgi:enoyl-CoA hydratase/carnithine racemase
VLLARDRPASGAHRELVRFYLDDLMSTEDAREGIRAFLEKRAPVWKHR